MFNTMSRIFIAVMILFCSASLVSADLTKDEEREINAYRLTKSKIAQFSQATKNLRVAFEKNPKLFDAPPGSKKENTMTDLINVTNSLPAAKKAIEDAGMTAKEYWTFQMAMLYAGTGHMVLKSGGKLPDGFSRENIEFYQANEAEFMKLSEDLKMFQEASKKSSTSDQQEEEIQEEEEEEEEEE